MNQNTNCIRMYPSSIIRTFELVFGGFERRLRILLLLQTCRLWFEDLAQAEPYLLLFYFPSTPPYSSQWGCTACRWAWQTYTWWWSSNYREEQIDIGNTGQPREQGQARRGTLKRTLAHIQHITYIAFNWTPGITQITYLWIADNQCVHSPRLSRVFQNYWLIFWLPLSI